MMPLYLKSPGNRSGAPLQGRLFVVCSAGQRVMEADGFRGWIPEPTVSLRAKPLLRTKTGQVADRRLICECLL
jgi:hypothetical protein